MGSAKSSQWYDDAYRSDPNLTADADSSTFGPLWREMARRVPDGARVVEIGCGAGQLGAMIAPRVSAYFGYDCSGIAIDFANRRLRSVDCSFAIGARIHQIETAIVAEEMLQRSFVGKLLVACEVLEHLADDHDLRIIKSYHGASVLFSLPTRDSESHVRHFPDEASVRDRYEPRVEGMTVERFDQWWIVEGRAR